MILFRKELSAEKQNFLTRYYTLKPLRWLFQANEVTGIDMRIFSDKNVRSFRGKPKQQALGPQRPHHCSRNRARRLSVSVVGREPSVVSFSVTLKPWTG
jgi:hypothetical protein